MSRIDQLLEFIKEDESDPFIHFALAQEYVKQNQLEKGLKKYLFLTKNHPNYIGTYYHLGKLYEELGDSQQAIIIYQRGIIISTEQNDTHALSELKNAKTNCELDL